MSSKLNELEKVWESYSLVELQEAYSKLDKEAPPEVTAALRKHLEVRRSYTGDDPTVPIEHEFLNPEKNPIGRKVADVVWRVVGAILAIGVFLWGVRVSGQGESILSFQYYPIFACGGAFGLGMCLYSPYHKEASESEEEFKTRVLRMQRSHRIVYSILYIARWIALWLLYFLIVSGVLVYFWASWSELVT